MIHTKIGNGYGGFTHAANETACGLPGKGRRNAKSYEGATCPDCRKVLSENFGDLAYEAPLAAA